MERPVFYFDITSVYAYLAAERIGELIPDADWRPILLAGLFKLTGRSSWFLSDERDARIAEIGERVQRYGLPPIRWPGALPQSVLDLQRAATVAKRHGREAPFALAGFRTTFVEGRDPSVPEELRRIASEAGLDGDRLLEEIRDQATKDELRRSTDEAHARGVVGVPTVVVGDDVFWGDDRLEEAARAAAAIRGAA